MQELLDWTEASAGVSVKFVVGAGGVGKSRLAREFALGLRESGWAAGFADLANPTRFFANKVGTLLLVDYPEENPQSVAEFLRRLRGIEGQRVLVLFLSRNGAEQWLSLFRECHAEHLLEGGELVLSGLDGIAAYEVFRSTQTVASGQLDTTPLPVSEEQLSEWLRQSPENVRALFIVAAAVHSAIHPADPVVRYDGSEVMATLAGREAAFLRQSAHALDLPEHLLLDIEVIAALRGRVEVSSALDALGVSEEAERIRVFRQANRAGIVGNEGEVVPIAPDILASNIVYDHLQLMREGAGEFVWSALGSTPMTQLPRIGRLIHDAEVVLGIKKFSLGQAIAAAVQGNMERAAELVPMMLESRLPLGLKSLDLAVWETVGEHTEGLAKASAINNAGYALLELDRPESAKRRFEKAIALNKRILKEDEKGALRELPNNHLNLARAHWALNETSAQLAIARRAISWSKRASVHIDGRPSALVAASIANYARALRLNGKRLKAEQFYGEAIEEYSRLLEQGSASVHDVIDYFEVLQESVHSFGSGSDDAPEKMAAALAFMSQLYETSPDRFGEEYLRALVLSADVLKKAGRIDEADDQELLALNLARVLRKSGAERLLSLHAVHCMRLCSDMYRVENVDLALSYAEEAGESLAILTSRFARSDYIEEYARSIISCMFFARVRRDETAFRQYSLRFEELARRSPIAQGLMDEFSKMMAESEDSDSGGG